VLSILSEEEPVEENTTEPENTEIIEEPEEIEIYVPELVVSLTEQERAVLIEKFGNVLKVKEALPERGFIKVIYEFSPEYFVEFNFDANLKILQRVFLKNQNQKQNLKLSRIILFNVKSRTRHLSN
jgi:hypothetical protein